MDLDDDWELLPDEGYLEINDDGGKTIYSRKHGTYTNNGFKTNYFICPPSPQFVENSSVPPTQQLVPFHLEPDHDQASKVPIEIKIIPSSVSNKISNPGPVDQDPVSQVFFKKMKEAEFVDIKVDSPRSSGATRGIVPPIEAFQFKEKADKEVTKGDQESKNMDHEDDEEGLNIWKWSLSGIGAICSFGMAAATICIIVLGSHHHRSKHRRNQKLQFQIYTDDKRIKQVVHHATKLNEAISAVRGVPISRAHITFGGYYDAAAL